MSYRQPTEGPYSQRSRESMFRRRSGMSPAKAQAMADYQAEHTDWSGLCKQCRRVIRGTLEELANHVCDPPS